MKKIDKALFIFLIIQPFLDFYLLYSEKITRIFKFSPSTIIRIIFIFVFFIITLINTKNDKKHWFIAGYLAILFVYLIGHVINSLNFNIGINPVMSFSYITEAFYYIRLLLPLMLIYIVYKAKITEEAFRESIVVLSLIISLEIIITNIFKISLVSYGEPQFIAGNIFDWFLNKDFTFEQLASKGYFYMANQISALTILILPINIYYAIRFSNKKAFISSLTLCLSMIMIGTRVAVYGWAIVSVVMFIAWIFFALIDKNKVEITLKKILLYISCFIILGFITLNSPLILRYTFTDYEEIENGMENKDVVNEALHNLNTVEEKKEFIKEYFEYYSLPKTYIYDLYYYEQDIDFWIDVMKLPYSERGGNRKLEKLITNRIYSLNNNKYDKYFGEGYSRYRVAEIYIESDFTVHYYTIGIIGILLLFGPYIVIATYSGIYMLLKRRLRLKTTMLVISVYVCLGISYFSGHVLDELIVTIPLAFISGYLLSFVRHDKLKYVIDKENVREVNMVKKSKNPKVSVIVPVYNVEKYIDKCLDSLVNQTLKDIEIIVVNDGTKDNSQSIIDKYAKKYKNIKSFIKENGGLSSARNYGIEKATGDYIAFVDSDDYVSYDMYEKLYNKAILKDYDVVVCNTNYIYDKKVVPVITNLDRDIDNKADVKKVMTYLYPAVWNKLYNKRLFKNNIRFKDKVWFEDVEFIYRLYPFINSIGTVDDYLINYVQREGAITHTIDKRLYDYVYNFDSIIKWYKDNKLFDDYKDEIEYACVRYYFATFVKRLAGFKDQEEFDKGVSMVIERINNYFPNYRKNKYLKTLTFKNLYLKHFNKKIANIVYKISNR